MDSQTEQNDQSAASAPPRRDAAAPTLWYGGAPRPLSRGDSQGRTIVYYGEYSNLSRAQQRAERYYPFTEFQSGSALTPKIIAATEQAFREYETILPVVFRPLREAPRGTRPDLVLMGGIPRRDNNERCGGAADLPEMGRRIWYDPEDLSNAPDQELLRTARHEIGHWFGLDDLYDYDEAERGEENSYPGTSIMGTLNAYTFSQADVATLQGQYGIPSASQVNAGRAVLPSLVRETDSSGHDTYTLPAELAVPQPHGYPSTYELDDPQGPNTFNGSALPVLPTADVSFVIPTGYSFNYSGPNGAKTSIMPSARTRVEHWIGSAGRDQLYSSDSYATTLEGGSGSDHYYMRPAGGAMHTIKDFGVNIVWLSEGSRTEMQSSDRSLTRIQADFNVRSVHTVRVSETHLAVILMSQNEARPTVIHLPINDDLIRWNRLSVTSPGEDGTVREIDVSLPDDLAAASQAVGTPTEEVAPSKTPVPNTRGNRR